MMIYWAAFDNFLIWTLRIVAQIHPLLIKSPKTPKSKQMNCTKKWTNIEGDNRKPQCGRHRGSKENESNQRACDHSTYHRRKKGAMFGDRWACQFDPTLFLKIHMPLPSPFYQPNLISLFPKASHDPKKKKKFQKQIIPSENRSLKQLSRMHLLPARPISTYRQISSLSRLSKI